MYRGRLWTMRQYAGYAGAEESNRRYRYLLEVGPGRSTRRGLGCPQNYFPTCIGLLTMKQGEKQ